jgi:4-diphosphocytidyl-2-C-methyl-D-erythritol kinase
MSGRRPAVVPAHAKLTWSLRITGVRPDGYHLLDAEMISLALHDVLTIEPGGNGVSVSGPYAAGVPTDPSNLITRALELAGATANVALVKHIPHGGGLGGGSSDAAAVLRWAGWARTREAGASAATVGADVPFCLAGGRARVRGIGEIIEPLPHIERMFTLVVPPLVVSTPAVYQAWDELGGPASDGPNDLEPAALAVEPRLSWWRDAISYRIGKRPVLAGSGATWFAEGEHQDALADLVDEGADIVVTQAEPAR